MSSPQEPVFYSDSDATVTLSRFVVGGQTFAMRNISSVTLARVPPSRFWPGFCLLIGLFIVGMSRVDSFNGNIFKDTRTFGVGLAAVMFVVMLLQRSKFAIVITASGDDVYAFISKDRERVAEIGEALNEAIIARG